MPDTDTEQKREAVTATLIRATSENGTVTVYGSISVTVDGPPDTDGHLRITVRHDSRSLWSWWGKHHDDTYLLDTWAPMPTDEREDGMPWLRTTAYRVRLLSNQRAPGNPDAFIATGRAERDPRRGEVLRFRHDKTNSSGEETPMGGVPR